MNKIKEAIGKIIVRLEKFGVPRTLQVILLIGLLQGIIFTFIVPPWWHNDEPTHFEYAWLLANRPELAQTAEVDEPMRRELAMSMFQHGYYDFYRLPPKFKSGKPVYIGASQANDPPLYYWLVSLPLRLLKNTSYKIQNYAGRLISVLIFLATLYVVWKALGELSGEGHPLQWLTTMFIALLPGLTDTMTSISNDVGAVLAFSIFLWIGISILNHGLTWEKLLGLIAILAICYYTKNTTLPAFPLTFFVLLFALFRNRTQWLSIAITGAVIAFAILFSIRWGDPAFWYRVSSQPQSTRIKTAKAPFGEYAFKIEPNGGFLGQFLSTPQVRPFRNKTITIGAWMWADQPITAMAPKISYYILSDALMLHSESKTVELTTTPTFVSYTINLPNDTVRAWLTLCSANALGYFCSADAPVYDDSASAMIYYDGIVLIPQELSAGEPTFLDGDTLSGSWNGTAFENKARNNSAESGWFWLSPQVSSLVTKVAMFGGMDIFIASIQDPQGTGWYYKDAAQTLFTTFWSNPARAKVFLLGGNLTYDLIRVFTAIGLLGLIPFSWKRRKILRWDLIVFTGFALAVVWGLTFMRGAIELLRDVPLIPWARYAFPVILPTAFLICAGWFEILQQIENRFHLTRMQSTSLFITALVGIDLLTVISILDFFYWKDQQAYVALFAITLIAIFTGINYAREKLK
ncbi:MAG: DUF2142 domain-containing protein, partial [Anaerolineales bacterium]|nr:DUF2142 domain-containing protein [Anaerolineales bacterium]